MKTDPGNVRLGLALATLCLGLSLVPPARSQPLVIDSYSYDVNLQVGAGSSTSNAVSHASGTGPGPGSTLRISVGSPLGDRATASSVIGTWSVYEYGDTIGDSLGESSTTAIWSFSTVDGLLSAIISYEFYESGAGYWSR